MKKIKSSLQEARQIHSVHLAVGSDERLLQFLFHHKEPRLREAPAVLLDEAAELSPADRVLIQCAIDLWNGEGGARFSNVLNVQGEDNFLNIIRAMLYTREFGEDEWPHFLAY